MLDLLQIIIWFPKWFDCTWESLDLGLKNPPLCVWTFLTRMQGGGWNTEFCCSLECRGFFYFKPFKLHLEVLGLLCQCPVFCNTGSTWYLKVLNCNIKTNISSALPRQLSWYTQEISQTLHLIQRHLQTCPEQQQRATEKPLTLCIFWPSKVNDTWAQLSIFIWLSC